MLFILVVLRLECDYKALTADLLWTEAEVECMVGLLHDCVVHAGAFEAKRIIRDRIEANRGWHLAFILKHHLHVGFLVHTGAAETQHWRAVGFNFFGLSDLQSWKSALAFDFEGHLALLRVELAVLNNGLEETAVLLHLRWVEAHSDVLVLVGNDAQGFRLDFECETLTLGGAARLHTELDMASNLVGIHDLEALA